MISSMAAYPLLGLIDKNVACVFWNTHAQFNLPFTFTPVSSAPTTLLERII